MTTFRSLILRTRPGLLAAVIVAVLPGACRREQVVEDTDKELFKTPRDLTLAREMNVATWASSYFRRTGRLPATLNEVRPSPEEPDPKEDPLHDAWGRLLEIASVGSGLVVRSSGADGLANTADDVEYRVPHAAGEP
jgi:hypothetical protein